MIEHIPDLMDAKIDAFKLEGRARAPDYVAMVTKCYHDAITLYESRKWDENLQLVQDWKKELGSVFNRGFDTGFYYRVPKETSYDNKATYRKIDIGQVTNFYKKIGVAEIKLWADLKIGDTIIIQGNKTGSITEEVKSMQVDGKNVTKVSREAVGVKLEQVVRENDHVYKKEPIRGN